VFCVALAAKQACADDSCADSSKNEDTNILIQAKVHIRTAEDVESPVAPASNFAIDPNSINIVSYNLFWWSAFGKNPHDGRRIINNIVDTLKPDILGVQECHDPRKVANEAHLQVASDFAGAQGTFVKASRVSSISKGHMDIGATGKWGPRYMTWAKLSFNGKEFYHFNTHWCVQNGNGRTCNKHVRLGGAQNMMAKINELTNNLATPAILTGDFNTFEEGFHSYGPKHFMDNGFALAKSAYVDAVFYSAAHWTLGHASVGRQEGSDHRPIQAYLTLSEGDSPSTQAPVNPFPGYGPTPVDPVPVTPAPVPPATPGCDAPCELKSTRIRAKIGCSGCVRMRIFLCRMRCR
jgi:endonuclease/exonuclease/phosphatase family metal-dependent hydrolase